MKTQGKATILPGDAGSGRADNFQYIERYPVVGKVSFSTGSVRELYEKWCLNGTDISLWTDVNLESRIEFKPNYYLIRVMGEGRFLYWRNGREVDRLVGSDLKGQQFSMEEGAEEDRTLARYFQEVVDDRLCYRCCGKLITVEGPRGFESVDCPLQDNTGAVVATIGALALI